MGAWTLPREGGCRCGQVRLRVEAPPLLTMACHCTGCQRMSAGAFSLSAAIPTEGFRITAGEPVIGGLHGATRHFFCPFCLSWMFTRPDGFETFVNLRATLLDDPGGFAEPFIETYAREKLPWASTPAVHRFETLPDMSAYESLIRDFAARIAGPPPAADRP
ncbi:MAG: GFA family protein [Microvirga sp.]